MRHILQKGYSVHLVAKVVTALAGFISRAGVVVVLPGFAWAKCPAYADCGDTISQENDDFVGPVPPVCLHQVPCPDEPGFCVGTSISYKGVDGCVYLSHIV